MKSKHLIIPFLTIVLLASLTSMRFMGDPESQEKKYHYFENPIICSGCHIEKFTTWSNSQHAKGFTGDFFQAQFYEVVLPSLGLDEKLANVHEDCIGCHSPTAFLSGDMIPKRSQDLITIGIRVQKPGLVLTAASSVISAIPWIVLNMSSPLTMILSPMQRPMWMPNEETWNSHGRPTMKQPLLKFMSLP